MRIRTICKAFVLAIAVCGIAGLAQTAQKPAFEVVSIRKSAPNVRTRNAGVRGDRLNISGASLRVLLQNGYQPLGRGGRLQIIGAPNWIDSDTYDVLATANCSGGPLSREQVQLMIQSLLEDRFQLKGHIETRDLPIYDLVVARDGAKLKVSADQTPPRAPAGVEPPQPCSAAPLFLEPPPPPPPPGTPPPANFALPRGGFSVQFNASGFTLTALSVPVGTLVATLQGWVERPIVDKTALSGLFDFKLRFSPEGLIGVPLPRPDLAADGPTAAPGGAADPVPSLFTAIQDLGLSLESTKGPVEVLVIESVQKPTEN